MSTFYGLSILYLVMAGDIETTRQVNRHATSLRPSASVVSDGAAVALARLFMPAQTGVFTH